MDAIALKGDIMERIMTTRIVPAATVVDSEEAASLAKALLEGGVNVVEFTFRTAAAEDAIRRVASSFPDMLVGAGTVLNEDQLRRAAAAGARFAVAPGLNPDLVRAARAIGLEFLPGVATPSEVDLGIRLGCKLLKFFPADVLGGPKAIKALAGPFGHTGVKFVPTGGINAANAAEYLSLPVVAAVGGSWMVAPALIKERNWAEITRLSREAVEIAMSARKQ